ncbi:tRNA dihydrouridine(20/20a) synthase DusA [Rhodobacteraceae bacterium XHP0102]|nr:tRNA dihydrouridine(20/20a) synthase DusA [Rhodobacteraceae bacterium XHP0102]
MRQSPITRNARLSVAPMMDWTDRHCRFFHRLMSHHALLYTEMVTAAALVNGQAARHLDYDAAEHPVALQLGGSDPAQLAQAVRIAAPWGYDEINLNVGCPSDRVQSGTFGAVLMKTPARVVDCVKAMQDACTTEITVKCRIGVDDQTPAEVLPDFLDHMRRAGVTRLTIHARKAWLDGLSPKENRSIPPLDYDLVYRMKAEFPDLHLSINGGISDLDAVRAHLVGGMDGVMVGRAAYQSPYAILGAADQTIYDAPHAALSAVEVAQAMIPYAARHIAQGGRLHHITRHMLGLFAGQSGARAWRRILSTEAQGPDAGPEVINRALNAMVGQD